MAYEGMTIACCTRTNDFTDTFAGMHAGATSSFCRGCNILYTLCNVRQGSPNVIVCSIIAGLNEIADVRYIFVKVFLNICGKRWRFRRDNLAYVNFGRSSVLFNNVISAFTTPDDDHTIMCR